MPNRLKPAIVVSESETRYFNRDLSWLEFNRRVLAQAADETVPLLERVRFLSIFTSNLDEFFMKRVGLVKRQIQSGVDTQGPDGLRPREVLGLIRESVAGLQNEQARVYTQLLLPSLEKAGIVFVRWQDLSTKERTWAEEWYRRNAFPALTPLAVDPTHRFPFISNLSENLAILATTPGREALQPAPGPGRRVRPRSQMSLERDPSNLFARLKIPSTIRAFLKLPSHEPGTGDAGVRMISLSEIVRNNLTDLFPGMRIEEQISFRVTRSAGIQKDDLDTANLLQSVEADIKQRRFARVVRVEIEPDAPQHLLRWLIDKLNCDSQDVYERPSGADFLALTQLLELNRPELKHKPWVPAIPPRLVPVMQQTGEKSHANFFAAIRKQDILVHHPYESFNASVERFIAAAASDPDVLTIKQTLYRTSPDSPFIESLVRAAETGKQVACLVEVRARFDEERNVRFARRLEKAGVHVAYGVAGLKTHCKTSLVVRQEKHGLRCYAHLGTGNYHPKTAQLYTDIGLLTADPDLTNDLVNLFNFLTGLAVSQRYTTLLVAPLTMRSRFNALIDREIEFARKGRPARIWAKVNSMEDREITEKLYAASQAGVKITIVCRGFCCLRPGVPGLSENIEVVSVVGRFLEHSRIFHFAAGQEDTLDGDWYIASADWMYRNLSNRVEVAAPVHDREARERLRRLFEVHMLDHRHAWDLSADGLYTLRTPPADAAPESVQVMGTFETLMREAYAI